MLIGGGCSQGGSGRSSGEVVAPAEPDLNSEEVLSECKEIMDLVASEFKNNPPKGDLRLLLDVVCKVQPREENECKG